MKKLKFAAAVGAATFLVAGIAFAQVAGSNGLTVTSTPVTTSVGSGSNIALGTFTITGDAQGVGLVSIPLTLTASGGATAADLSNCQVFNASNVAVGSAFTPVSGSNTFVFNSGITAGGSTGGTQTYTIRCNVASNVSSGAMFTFSTGAPLLTNALNVNVITPTSVQQGGVNNVLALITLDATHSGGNINIGSVPVTINGNGASTAQLSNCQLRNINNLSGTLTTTAPLQNGTTLSFSLAAPLSLAAGTRTTVALTCSVDPATPIGGSFVVSVAPSGLGATAVSNGAVITPTSSVASNGSALPLQGTVLIASTATPPSTGGGIPTVPNTGAGGNAEETALVLALSALVAVGAGLYVRRAYR